MAGRAPQQSRQITGRPESQRERVGVFAHGFSGKTPTLGFMYAAKTAADEYGAFTLMPNLIFKLMFINFFKLLQQRYTVTQFHFFSHSCFDGPIFADEENSGQFTLPQIGQLPKLQWADNAFAKFYGCNAGVSAFSGEFARTQGVKTGGASGYTYFSRTRKTFDPIDDPNGTPVYQDSYMDRANVVVKHYGHTDNTLGEFLLQRLLTMPEWLNAKGTKPMPFNWFDPKGRPLFKE